MKTNLAFALTLALASLPAFSALADSGAEGTPDAPTTDVAMDARTGETFILAHENNPKGEIVVSQGGGAELSRTLRIFDSEMPGAHCEIEMSRGGRLTFLVANENGWFLGEFQRTADGSWHKAEIGFSGEGPAAELAALPDGRFTLSTEKELLLIERNSTGFTIRERIDAGKLQARLGHFQVPSAGSAPVARADDNATGNGYGLTAGLITGLGFAYRRFFTGTHGAQVGGVALIQQNGNSFANVGAEYLHTISRWQQARLYWLAGASAYYSRQKQYIYRDTVKCPTASLEPCVQPDPQEIWVNDRYYNFGAGLGIELQKGPVGFSIELPISMRFRRDSAQGFRFDSLVPIPNVSIVYYLPKRR